MSKWYTPTDELPKTHKIYSYELLKTNNIFDFIYRGDINTVKIILGKGTNINLRNDKDQTLLHYALLYNQTDIAKLLLSLGADFNTVDSSGEAVRDIMKIRNLDLDNHFEGYNLPITLNPHIEHESEKLGVCEDCYCCNIM